MNYSFFCYGRTGDTIVIDYQKFFLVHIDMVTNAKSDHIVLPIGEMIGRKLMLKSSIRLTATLVFADTINSLQEVSEALNHDYVQFEYAGCTLIFFIEELFSYVAIKYEQLLDIAIEQ